MAGQSLADARAVRPDLVTQPMDRAADTAVLDRLGRWAERYTPWVALDGIDGLMLDVSGCAHLMGGERALLADMQARITRSGLTARLALADTPGAAWALARFGERACTVSPVGGAGVDLADLPVAGLRLSPPTVQLLVRFGLARIGDLYTLPRAVLARRFESRQMLDAVLSRLDQALGARHEPVNPRSAVAAWRSRVVLPEPILERAQIDSWLPRLIAELMALLETEQLGARALTLTLFGVDGAPQTAALRLARPTRDAAHVFSLFADRLDAIDPGFGFDALMLEAVLTEPLKPAAASFLVTGAGQDSAALIDRLVTRLGSAAIYRLDATDCALPEQAEAVIPADAMARGAQERDVPRPLLLLDRPDPVSVIAEVPDGPPMRFSWRRVDHRIARAQGPERIAPEWWQTDALTGTSTARTRDYYLVEDDQGRRYWLFRHGLYGEGEEAGAPVWFLHGLAA